MKYLQSTEDRKQRKDINSSENIVEHSPGGQWIEARSKVQHETETDMTIFSKEPNLGYPTCDICMNHE